VSATERWVLLRHGESTANRDGVYSGWVDVPLTARGRAQAREAGARLGGGVFARVLSSDLVRATETATLAAPGSALDIHIALRERSLGEWAGRDRSALKRSGASDVLLTWHGAAPGGESLGTLAHRVVGCLAALPPAAAPTLLVAHGGVIRVLLGLLEGVPAARLWERDIPNAVPLPVVVPAGTWSRLLDGLPPA
jgi:broad specificity phosphatase PhoE